MWPMSGIGKFLQVCPVIWEGLDERGRELIHGLDQVGE
jgi:hypothetical protein